MPKTQPSTIRQTMDPKGTLPDVALIPDPSARQARGSIVPESRLIVSEGQTVGTATLVHNRANGGEAYFHGVKITDPEQRGRGIGLATYLAAIEIAHQRGETFRTEDWTQTEAAARVWTHFIEKGVAEVIEPFKPAGELTDGTQLMSGHMRIPPTSTG